MNTIQIEEAVVRQALEALKLAQQIIGHPDDDHSKLIAEAITALTAALEQPTGREPCGWRKKYNGEWAYAFSNDAWEFIRKGQPAIKQSLTTEQPAQQWLYDPMTGKAIQDEQPAQQEPVAKMEETWASENGHEIPGKTELYAEFFNDPPPKGTLLYTRPQARELAGLTDEEMRQLEKEFNAERVRTSDEEYLVIYPGDYWAWQRAIEAKLKEKNQ